MARITENDIKLSALYVLFTSGPASTTDIKKELIRVFHPVGEDNDVLAGRTDTKFTQIVRNLMGSHWETNGMNELTSKDNKGYFQLTAKGESLVKANQEELQYLFRNPFRYDDVIDYIEKINLSKENRKILVYTEEDTVSEGGITEKTKQLRNGRKNLERLLFSTIPITGNLYVQFVDSILRLCMENAAKGIYRFITKSRFHKTRMKGLTSI